jgi:hypothetical protein
MTESDERSRVRGVAGFRYVKRENSPVTIETQKDAQGLGARERIRDFWPQ